MNNFYNRISEQLVQTVKDLYALEVSGPFWELSSRPEFGDLSSSVAMRLAAKIKRNPLEVAQEIRNALALHKISEIENIEVVKPGFVNLSFSPKFLRDSLILILEKKEDFFRQEIKQKVLLEFVSANPTGPLSIAHGRQAVVGDVIGNLLLFFGNELTREYYINDQGRQIFLLGESVKSLADKLQGKDTVFPEDGYQGDYVEDVAKEYLSQSPKDIAEFVLKTMLARIKIDLEKLGVNFDVWQSQRVLIKEKKVEKAVNDLKEKDVIYEREGATWFASTKFGDDKDRVICKADGELTYFASDIAYHENKMERGFDELINLWGPDHHGYIPRVKACLAALGYNPQALNVIIIQLVTISTKQRMSRRKGTAILLSDLIEQVGRDTARFYYLTRRNSSLLEFDLDLAKEASMNNPYYYIQYACARIESIFKKAEGFSLEKKWVQSLNDQEEMSLARMLLQFYFCLERAYVLREPVFVVEYLKNLAAAFHKFYEKRKIIGQEDLVMNARLNLLAAVRVVFHCGLRLLGIAPVSEM